MQIVGERDDREIDAIVLQRLSGSFESRHAVFSSESFSAWLFVIGRANKPDFRNLRYGSGMTVTHATAADDRYS